MKGKILGLIGAVFFVAPVVAAQQDSCIEAAFDKSLYGLCKAYTSGVNCLDPKYSDTERCVNLRQNFLRKSGGQDIAAVLSGQIGKVSATIGTNGGTIELPDIAKVWFPQGAFDFPRQVMIEVTSDNDVNQLFDETAFIFRTLGRLPYELRITTGDAPPLSDTIHVEMSVPTSMIESMPADYAVEAFVGIEQGGDQEIPHTVFEIVESQYDVTNQILTFEVPGAAFARNQLTRDQYQAIITLAPTPGAKAPVATSIFSLSLSEVFSFFIKPADAAASVNSCQAASISCPVSGGCNVVSPYSPARSHPVTGTTRPHMGVDYTAAEGTPIMAAANGDVERSYTSTSYGETIVVRHKDKSATLYAHLKSRAIQNGSVSAGQVIGYADSTGLSTGSHLHFEYVPNGQIFGSKSRIDPHACVDSLASGSITVSDSGYAADDAFEVLVDGFSIGQTSIGGSNTLAINNLKAGSHTLTLNILIAPDNVGTYTVSLGDGLKFADGSASKTGWDIQGATLVWSFVVPSP